MATILFTWELGKGSGHITPYIDLIKKLEQQGHVIYFAARSLNKVHRLFQETNTIYLQAPILNAPAVQQVKSIDSYAKILNNYGYAEAEQIAGMIKAWRNLYAIIKPDLVIFDFSPTALLAARDCTFKRLKIGTGFYTPTDITPTIGLATLQGGEQDTQQLLDFENSILNNINQALTLNQMTPLACFYDMHQADISLFSTFKELDYYPDREDANYIGISHSPAGLEPEWPEQPGTKVFMYLNPFQTLPQLLDIINSKKLPTLVYAVDVPEQFKEKYASDTLRFVDRPLDMHMIGKTADVAICNGNHGTLLELLLSGIPVLSLPLHAEQNIISRNVEKIGAGLTAPQKTAEEMQTKLELLLNEDRFKTSAVAFAERHSNHDFETMSENLLTYINELIKNK